jgi:hypothetical protein
MAFWNMGRMRFSLDFQYMRGEWFSLTHAPHRNCPSHATSQSANNLPAVQVLSITSKGRQLLGYCAVILAGQGKLTKTLLRVRLLAPWVGVSNDVD